MEQLLFYTGFITLFYYNVAKIYALVAHASIFTLKRMYG